MPDSVTIQVLGDPAPQGSKRHVGGGRMVESSKKVRPWREAVKWGVIHAGNPTFAGPVFVDLRFTLRRPNGHYGTGRNVAILKPSAPLHPATRPDLDKLIRSTLDGLTDAGVISDDSRIVTITARKVYGLPGCTVIITEANRP